MKSQLTVRAALVGWLAAGAIAGCGGDHVGGRRSAQARRGLTATAGCAVTRERHSRPPGPMVRLLGGEATGAYGRGPLWVLLPSKEGNAARLPGGAIFVKVAWYVGVTGLLHGTAIRIDGPRAPPRKLEVSGPSNAAQRMQASGLALPSTGCWKVTGVVAGHRLSWIFRASDRRRQRTS